MAQVPHNVGRQDIQAAVGQNDMQARPEAQAAQAEGQAQAQLVDQHTAQNPVAVSELNLFLYFVGDIVFFFASFGLFGSFLSCYSYSVAGLSGPVI